jgi:hypothetical protein
MNGRNVKLTKISVSLSVFGMKNPCTMSSRNASQRSKWHKSHGPNREFVVLVFHATFNNISVIS